MKKVFFVAIVGLTLSLALTGCAQATAPETQKIDETLLPIISANIELNGDVNSSNVPLNVTHDNASSTGEYLITSTLITTNAGMFIVQLTPAQNNKCYMNWFLMGNVLYCRAYNYDGTLTNTSFNVTVWKNRE